jgi:predicted dinucleotide-utilizing enzyme
MRLSAGIVVVVVGSHADHSINHALAAVSARPPQCIHLQTGAIFGIPCI